MQIEENTLHVQAKTNKVFARMMEIGWNISESDDWYDYLQIHKNKLSDILTLLESQVPLEPKDLNCLEEDLGFILDFLECLSWVLEEQHERST